LKLNDIQRSAPCRVIEEQFHLPAALVDLRDGKCGQGEVVGKKFQVFVGLGILVADAAQGVGIHLGRIDGGQDHRLI
jgi:hypothetical protein